MFGMMWGLVTYLGVSELFFREPTAVVVWTCVSLAMSAEVARQRRHYRRALRWQAHQRTLQARRDG
jgi:hypothetical protein